MIIKACEYAIVIIFFYSAVAKTINFIQFQEELYIFFRRDVKLSKGRSTLAKNILPIIIISYEYATAILIYLNMFKPLILNTLALAMLIFIGYLTIQYVKGGKCNCIGGGGEKVNLFHIARNILIIFYAIISSRDGSMNLDFNAWLIGLAISFSTLGIPRLYNHLNRS